MEGMYPRLVAVNFALLVCAGAARADDAPPEGYLVLPFTNITGGPALDPYVGALAQGLAERLEAHPRFSPCYGPAVLPDAQPPVSDEEAAKLARAAGARFVIAGGF